MPSQRTRRITSVFHCTVLCICVLAASVAQAQEKKQLTLRDVAASPVFFGSAFSGGEWAPEGPVIRYIDQDEDGATHLVGYNLENDVEERLLDGASLVAPDTEKRIRIEEYSFSGDGRFLLIYTESAPVWRLNTKGFYYLYDMESKTVRPLSDRALGYQMFAKISPDGSRAAFVRDRNIYLVDLGTMKETAITDDGEENSIINGTTDWVYEEEFALRDGWDWSPDGRSIAFLTFDESRVPEFAMMDYREKYPRVERFKYPKAGEHNSDVRVGVYDLSSGKTRFFDTGTWTGQSAREYIPRMGWTPEIDGAHQVWIMLLNRRQNHLELVYGNPADGTVRPVLEETSESWVEVENFGDDTRRLTYLEDGKHFVYLSDKDGYNHLYLYRNGGTFLRQVTTGSWEVSQFLGVDESRGAAFFTGTLDGALHRHLYSVPLFEAGVPERITGGEGTHSIDLSSDRQYYIDTHSSVDSPPVTTLHEIDGEQVKVLEANEGLIATLETFVLPAKEFLTLQAEDGTSLDAWLIKPSDFDASRSYPLLMYTYGGPASQEVQNRWGGFVERFHWFLAEEMDIVVACVDNRGASGRGKEFASALYRNMGTVEAQDQIAAARHFGSLPFIDATRVAIWGWSYGGYNSVMSMLKYDGPETFKVAMSVAMGSDWELYDTIYTERYMSTPEDNPDGYREARASEFAGRMKDEQELLLVHGDMDDNAHFQNTVQLASALQRAGKQFSMMVYPGGNHGMRGTGNPFVYLHLFTMLSEFLSEKL